MIKVYVKITFYDENGLHPAGSITMVKEEDFNPFYMKKIPEMPPIPANLGDLADVSTVGASDGDVLTFDGVDWIPAVAGGGVESLEDLDDVSVEGATNGQVLAYDSTDDAWIAKTLTSGGIPFVEGAGSSKVWTGTISDVTALTAGMMMLYKTPEAISENDSSSSSITININDLGAKKLDKVSIINATKYYGMDKAGTILLLVYDGTQWVDITSRITGKVAAHVETTNANLSVFFGSSNTSDAKVKFTHAGVSDNLRYNPYKNLLQLTGGKIQAQSFDLTSSSDTIGDFLKGAISAGLTLGTISDVDTTSVSDGQVLTYDAANTKWKPTTPSGGGGDPYLDYTYDATQQSGGQTYWSFTQFFVDLATASQGTIPSDLGSFFVNTTPTTSGTGTVREARKFIFTFGANQPQIVGKVISEWDDAIGSAPAASTVLSVIVGPYVTGYGYFNYVMMLEVVSGRPTIKAVKQI